MSTIRTNSTGQGAGTFDESKPAAPAPMQVVIGNSSVTARHDAAGASAGDTTQMTFSSAIITETP